MNNNIQKRKYYQFMPIFYLVLPKTENKTGIKDISLPFFSYLPKKMNWATVNNVIQLGIK